MEKAHGWSYVRSKNNGKPGNRGSSIQPTPQSSNMKTPMSRPVSIATPSTGFGSSSISPCESGMGQQVQNTQDCPFSFAEPPMMNTSQTDGGDFQLYPETSSFQGHIGATDQYQHNPPNTSGLSALDAQFDCGNPNGMLPLSMNNNNTNNSNTNNNNQSVFESSVPDLLDPVGLDGSPMTSTDSSSSLNYELDWNNTMEQQNFGIQQYPYVNNTPLDMSLVDQQSLDFGAMQSYSCDPALPMPSPLVYNACQFDEAVYDLDSALGGGFTVV